MLSLLLKTPARLIFHKNSKHGSYVDYYAESGMDQVKSDFSTENAVMDKLDLELAKAEIEKIE
ncbi:MAG: hypothetical protein L6V87_01600 [Ruminococcus sp.]|nr:MAG: hypothetical protein L6V87_01600 [Ruminococcus sp.]